MWEIVMTTWYQETPGQVFEEVYMKRGFEHMEDACEVFAKDYLNILEYFPVEKIEIRWNRDRTKESQRDERIDEILKK
jgi:hypothetical protein